MKLQADQLIGIKCEALAESLGNALLQTSPASNDEAQRLNRVADATTCALMALGRAARAKDVFEFAHDYDRAVRDASNAEQAARQRETVQAEPAA